MLLEGQDGIRGRRRVPATARRPSMPSAEASRISCSSTFRCPAPPASRSSPRWARSELPLFVFVTAFDKYALKAFDVHALDYLLKPFDRDRFLQALARARQQLERPSNGDLRRRLLALVSDLEPAAATPRALRHQVGRPRVLRPRRRDRLDRSGRQLRQAPRRHRDAPVARDDERRRGAAAARRRSTASTAATS